MTNDFLQPPQGWLTPSSARLQVPAPAQRGLVFRTISKVSALFGRQQVPDIFTVMHINPSLFWPWLLFASRLMPFGRLSGREREMVILRTAWNCRSRYEWGQHVELALRAGVSGDDIVQLTGEPSSVSDRCIQALIQACNELCESSHLSDGTWGLLAEHYDEKRLIEIILLIGHYRMIAGFLNASGLTLEPNIEATLQDFYTRLKVKRT